MRRLEVLILLFLGSTFLLSPAFGSSMPGLSSVDTSIRRDSLLRLISATGSIEMNCHLSYPIGSSELNPSFGNNAIELATLRNFLRLSLGDSLLLVRGITLTGYCSPDGAAPLNAQLAANRVYHLCHYLSSTDPYFNRHPWRVNSCGADWQGLRHLLDSPDYHWRKQALEIIDSPASVERKKLDLAALDNGRAHKVLYDLYPQLRRVEVKVSYDVQTVRQQTIWSIVEQEQSHPDTVADLPPHSKPLKTEKHPVKASPRSGFRLPLFALKTNLLFDAALAPNVELEVPLGKRWSVLGEYTFPWWLRSDDSFCFEMLQAGAEARYWLGNRKVVRTGKPRNPLTGWFVGAYTSAGYYDFQFQHNYGYQGEFYIAAGLSGGYALRLSRRLNLEFSLGLGWLTTQYYQYDVERSSEKTELVRSNYGRFQWTGPTKAKISLVWIIGSRKGGKR